MYVYLLLCKSSFFYYLFIQHRNCKHCFALSLNYVVSYSNANNNNNNKVTPQKNQLEKSVTSSTKTKPQTV